EEMPAMERLYRQHREVGFTLVAVSVDADSRLVAPFVTAHKFTFPVALDPSMSMANTYGVRALPSSFIVGRDGTLAALAIGPRHWDNDAAHSLIEGLARSHAWLRRRAGRLQCGALLVPVALRAPAVSVLSLVHHRHVGGGPLERPDRDGAPAGDDPRCHVRDRLLRRVRRAGGVV